MDDVKDILILQAKHEEMINGYRNQRFEKPSNH
jgi:hypothetical protein